METLQWVELLASLPLFLFAVGRGLSTVRNERRSWRVVAAVNVGVRWLLCLVALVVAFVLVGGLTDELAPESVGLFFVVFTLTGTVATRAVDRGLVPLIRLPDGSPLPKSVRRRQFAATLAAVAAVGLVATLYWNRVFFGPPELVGVGVVLPVSALLWSAVRGRYVCPSFAAPDRVGSARVATDEERERFDRAERDSSLSLGRKLVVQSDGSDRHVLAGGDAESPWVAIRPELLSRLPDDALAVALAQAVGKRRARSFEWTVTRQYVRLAFAWTLVGALIVIVSVLWGDSTALGLVPVALGVAVVHLTAVGLLSHQLRRAELAGDAFASERTSVEAVRALYEDHGAELAAPRTTVRGLDAILNTQPTLDHRLRRLASTEKTPD